MSSQAEQQEPETEEQEPVEKAEETQSKKEELPKREPKEVTILDTELEALQEELEATKKKFVLGLAESENARKRMQKERQELTQYAVERMVTDFLAPIDRMEAALGFVDNMSDEVKNWAIGFQMILQQFKDVLADHNIVAFDSVGQTFDPHFHEAVESEESTEVAPNTVTHEFVRGYKSGDRVIRPARVKVSKGPEEESEKEIPEE